MFGEHGEAPRPKDRGQSRLTGSGEGWRNGAGAVAVFAGNRGCGHGQAPWVVYLPVQTTSPLAAAVTVTSQP